MKAHLAAALVPRKGENHCEAVDRMPSELRPLVHEYGLSTVITFLAKGVTKPKDIRYLVNAVWNGAREPGNKHPNHDRNGAARAISALDRAIVSMGGGIPAIKLARALYELGYTVMPYGHPTFEMMQASMDTVSNFDMAVTKQEKHMRRLIAATRAYANSMWSDA